MKSLIKPILISLRNTVLLILILEMILSVVFNYNDKRRYDKNVEFKISSGAYQNVDPLIVKEIYDELYYLDTEWESYVHFKLREKSTKHNTIDKKGHRKTINLNLKTPSNPLKIFCLGGSTMYSTGARDSLSIPSQLSKLLYEKFPQRNIEITNLGCHGYNRSVENIQLQKELLANNIPDMVIFYDGVNEVISGYLNNKAGLPTNAKLNKEESKVRFNYVRKIKLLLNTSYTSRFIKYLQNKIFKQKTFTPDLSNQLSEDIANNYIRNLQITNALSMQYNFKVFNFLQPNIYSHKTLSEHEKIMAKKNEYYKRLYINSYDLILENDLIKKDSTFHNISNAFNKNTETIYTDFCHIAEKGNTIISKNIFKFIQSYFEKNIETIDN
ncbi:SGNH/GDSL hydrolase family protein [Aquimarina sp. MMG016]|uniref:SGNH/GDSL hydrolase family protein n=1 Tax=Aquimarina sp. MMG016 TaxID=2822690 RepID=UPI001B3A21E0|nr:SGNH/GDSL hydrolase family protein [Aquimarina sp. MMG016]MBQ4821785.1 SGNH/GDSL hydrolase family protein [Aquimarina sp. MMG016]